MNNSVCGKTMEDLRNRTNLKLANSKKHYLKLTSKPSYMSNTTDLVAIRKTLHNA